MASDLRKLIARERELREKETLSDAEKEELKQVAKKISAALEEDDDDYRREGRSASRRSLVDSLSLPELVQMHGQLKASGNEQAANNLQAVIVARTEGLCEREGVDVPVARSKSKSKQDEQPENSGSGKKSFGVLDNLLPRLKA